ncbi:MAG TPA: hypothetical protein VHL57_11660 [Flavobacteriales bacterium]|jgi:chromosome segregation ATPase|nr:hypothetical protein [Flavobacteriales bacterium]
MSDLAERIRNARTQLGRVLRDKERLTASVSELENELRDRQRASEVLQARVAELERENEVLRAVRPAPVAVDRAGTKERIDELVSEIDRCLALLHT